MSKPWQCFFQSLRAPVCTCLRRLSSTTRLRTVTIKTFGKTPDRIKPKLLDDHRDGNLARIAHLKKHLELDQYGIGIADELELIKCLYPTRYARIGLPDGVTYSNHQLETLGKRLLCLQVYQAYLSIFKRSDSDVCGYDFNYYHKIHNMSNAKQRPASVIHRYLKHNNVGKLARLQLPNNRIPLRVQYYYDQKSFSAIIGYISMSNEDHIVRKFLEKIVAEKLIRTVLLR